MTKKEQRGRTTAVAERTDAGPFLSQMRVKPQAIMSQLPLETKERLSAEMAVEVQARLAASMLPPIGGSSEEDGCCFTVAKKMTIGYCVSIMPPKGPEDECSICCDLIGVACCPPPCGACINNDCGITVTNWVPVSVKFEVVATDLCKVHCRIVDIICCSC